MRWGYLVGGSGGIQNTETCLVTLRHVTLHQFLCFRRKCNCYASARPAESCHNPLPIFCSPSIRIRILLSFQYWRWRIFTCCTSCDHNKGKQLQKKAITMITGLKGKNWLKLGKMAPKGKCTALGQTKRSNWVWMGSGIGLVWFGFGLVWLWLWLSLCFVIVASTSPARKLV